MLRSETSDGRIVTPQPAPPQFFRTCERSSVRSRCPERIPRAAPSALTKLFAFVQIAARDPPALPIESAAPPAIHAPQLIIIYYFRSNRWLPNGVNEGDLQRAGRWPLQGTANPDGPGTTGLGGCSRRYQVSPAHPPSSLTPSSVPRLLVYSRPSSDT
ncbi:hypothetical protein EVAR_25090_1 [Eumeta japonica]|uniref:Uncharacterized protein n=1 Tax=Eumeta variegata TaxID=151549 RepID=A0A4C1Z2A4_EUMVA|nr:hypothetical protein EVAR_25090_1 [Eumeta japonica]